MDRRPFRFAVQATTASDAQGGVSSSARSRISAIRPCSSPTTIWVPAPHSVLPVPAAGLGAHRGHRRRRGAHHGPTGGLPSVLHRLSRARRPGQAATLNLLSDGRFELGIGAGWSADEYDAMGLTFETPARRIAKLKEVVALIKAHCGDGELDRSGEYVNVHGYQGTPHRCSARIRRS